jgi:hypothetical protein
MSMGIAFSQGDAGPGVGSPFVYASLIVGAAGDVDATPVEFCKRSPDNYSFYKSKCLSDKRVELSRSGPGPEREARGQGLTRPTRHRGPGRSLEDRVLGERGLFAVGWHYFTPTASARG